MRRNLLRWATAAAVTVAAIAALALSAPASATVNVTINATVTGVSAAQPTNGTLYLFANPTAKHHTRSVEYRMHDDYLKTINLVTALNPIGVVLAREDISNACDSSSTDGSVNPVGGFETGLASSCANVLHLTAPAPMQLGGDLIGRFCRVAFPPDTNPGDCTSDPVANVGPAAGTGRYLTTGAKDHGGMTEVDYYTNVTGVNVEVDVLIPAIAAVDYNGVKRTIQPLITRIVLLPTTVAPHAVVVLNS